MSNIITVDNNPHSIKRIRRRMVDYFCPPFRSKDTSAVQVMENNITIIIVHSNTLQLTAHAIYSIYEKIAYTDGAVRIVVVDNCSTDSSASFLEILARNGYIDLVKLTHPVQHGPGLNIGARHVHFFEENLSLEQKTSIFLFLDSDVIILRGEVLTDSRKELFSQKDNAAAAQLQSDQLSDDGGYPHPSCLLMKKNIYESSRIKPFMKGGVPAKNLAKSIRRNNYCIVDFPFRKMNYILHIGRGTLKKLKEYHIMDNPLYKWSLDHYSPHYHGNPEGEKIFRNEQDKFVTDIKNLDHPYDNYLKILSNYKDKNRIHLRLINK
ncbi:MAG: glycosyltransferase [Chitinivibrionales bacterium]|nr:glycosyltransferase [Chitinivibrionales bacterium]